LLLGTDNKGRTACYRAAEWGRLENLQILWEWAEEKLTTEEIKYKLLLGTDNEGRTAWYMAAERVDYRFYKHYGNGLKLN